MGLGKTLNGVLETSASGGGGSNVTIVGPLGQAAMAASVPVVIASDQTAIPVTGTVTATVPNPLPISAASLPLPTGASTSANQTNGSQKTQVVDGSGNVISATSNALDVNLKTSAATVTVSGSVTANAGTNLNTSALATSANQTNASQKTQIVDGSGNVVGSTGNALDVNLKTSVTGLATASNQTTEITSLQIIDDPVYSKGGTQLIQNPTFSQASDNNTPVTTAATTDLIAAPSAGNHLEIFRLHVSNSSATPVLIQFIDSTPSNKFYPCYLPQYGLMSIRINGGWHLASAKKLQMVTSAAASVYWHVDYRTVAD